MNDAVTPTVGQVWQLDKSRHWLSGWTYKGRRLRIVAIDDGKATCLILTPTVEINAHGSSFTIGQKEGTRVVLKLATLASGYDLAEEASA